MSEKVIINFKKIKQVGKGFHSKVFKAEEINIKRIIAIKEIDSKKLKRGFYDEAILLNTSKNPNVVDMHYAGENEDNKLIYLAMPLYENGSLQNIINGEHTIKDLLMYTQGILSGLSHIHSKGILHLDLKPDNILISDDNQALISDFGVSMNFDLETSIVEANNLYPLLTPPEVLINNTVSIQSDIYQLGILMFLLYNQISLDSIASKFDFSKENIRKTITQIRNLIKEDKLFDKKFNPHIHLKIQKIILKCMNPDLDKRYKSVDDVRNEFSSIDSNESLLWSFKKGNNLKIFTKNIDLKKEEYTINNKNEITYRLYKNEKLIEENKNIDITIETIFR